MIAARLPCIQIQRATEEKTCQPEANLGATSHTRHKARQRNAKRSRTQNPKPTHGAHNRPQPPPRARQACASGSGRGPRRDVRARLTQGHVAPTKGNADLSRAPRDEGSPREARPASLHRLVSQVPAQCHGPKAPKGLDRHRHEVQGGGHLPIHAPPGGVPGSGRKPPHTQKCVQRSQ
jgi:hypothetical protein